MMARFIYFAGSIRAGRKDAHLYARIVELLKGYGTVLTEHVGDPNITEAGELKSLCGKGSLLILRENYNLCMYLYPYPLYLCQRCAHPMMLCIVHFLKHCLRYLLCTITRLKYLFPFLWCVCDMFGAIVLRYWSTLIAN